MTDLENKIRILLDDLHKNYYAIGIKAEYEDEGAGFDDVLHLKKLAGESGLDFVLKIGGCGAVKDLNEAEAAGTRRIVAPMIESAYAVKKYVQAVRNVFDDDKMRMPELFINIETLTGINCLDEILRSKEFKYIKGIVFGRTDMALCLGLGADSVNGDEIYNLALSASQKVFEFGKDFVIGGGVSADSAEFFKKFPESYLNGFETRKVVFDAQKILHHGYLEEGIQKALDFELMWIKNKQYYKKKTSKYDLERIEILQSRQKSGICI